jgi:hypothetical protein
MEDIAAARNARQGLLLAFAQALGKIGDGGPGMKASVGQLQRADAPGVAVAVFFLTEQVAVGTPDVGAGQRRQGGGAAGLARVGG